MNQDNDSQQPVENGVNELLQQESYGVSLREARENAGMSIDEVAEKTLISVDILKAIENSQSDALPSVTFVQGYIRSYAKILNLKSDNIISAYLKTMPDKQQVLSPKGLVSTSQASSSLFLVAIFIVLLVVVGSIYWLFVKLPDSENFNKSVQDEQLLDNNQLPHDQQLLVEPELFTFDQSHEEPVIDDSPLSESTAETPVVEQVIEATEHPILQDERNKAVQTDSIRINALNDTWCELKDAQGDRLIYRLINKGEQLKFVGSAPYSIFLGVSSAVEIKVNQQSISYEHLVEQDKKTIFLEISSAGEVTRLNRN